MKRLLLSAMTVLVLGTGVAHADDLFRADVAWYQGDPAKAVAMYRLAASHGDRVAMRRLGNIYVAGSALGEPNYAEAANWYRQAATLGDAESLDRLALLYRDGDGVARDYTEALKLLRRAAVKGYALSKYHLGEMYKEGFGVPRDDLRAYMWFSLGAVSGSGPVADARDAVAHNMTAKQLADAKNLTDACLLRNFSNCD